MFMDGGCRGYGREEVGDLILLVLFDVWGSLSLKSVINLFRVILLVL